jgi:formylglycine-generating enzyme required for sulfatase activity
MLLVVLLIGWINRAYIKEQYYWLVLMGPSVLTGEREKQISANPGSDFQECATACPKMVVVPAGKFLMGSPHTEKLRQEPEGPQHWVTIAKPFAVGKMEVTFAQWDVCVAAGACPPVSDNRWGRENRTVINVSWDEAKRYVVWLSRITGKEYRLLTEAEWEYAARAGTTTTYFWGDDIGDGRANCDGCGSEWDLKQTAPVGSFKANPFGLHDMHGNVDEWVEDRFHDSYQGAPPDGSAWVKDGDPDRRVHRDGSWRNPPRRLRSAYRNEEPRTHRYDNLGFRIARTLNPSR